MIPSHIEYLPPIVLSKDDIDSSVNFIPEHEYFFTSSGLEVINKN